MPDETGQKVSQQSEIRPLVRMSAADLPAADHRNARLAPIDRQQPFVRMWLSDGSIRRRLSYGVTLGAPLLLLVALVFAMRMSPLVALLVSALAYAGLFMFFIWQPQIELERETTAEDVKKSLAKSRELIGRIHGLTPELRPLLSGSEGELRLERICNLADRATTELASKQGTSLGTADRLETRISEFFTILDLFQKTAGAGTVSSPSFTPLGEEVVQRILPLMEMWLADLSTSLKAEDALNLDVAMRVMRDTLESEGLSRTE